MTLSLLRAGRLTPSQGSWATSGSAHRKSLKVRFCSAPTAQHAPVQTEHMLQQQVAVSPYSTRSTKAAVPVLDSHLHGMNCLLSCACSSRFECTVGASACSCYHACAHACITVCTSALLCLLQMTSPARVRSRHPDSASLRLLLLLPAQSASSRGPPNASLS